MADSLYAIKVLVFDKHLLTLEEYREALRNNYGKDVSINKIEHITKDIVRELLNKKIKVNEEQISKIATIVEHSIGIPQDKKNKYDKLLEEIDKIPKFGNDIPEVDSFARDVAYTYTKPLEKYKNPRGGQYQAGLYPVSANVPLGGQTGATPDGRLAHKPIADGVSPSAGKDVKGPTAAANSVSKLVN